MQRNSAVGRSPIVSRDRVTETIRHELRVATVIERRMTVEQISNGSGVEVRAIRSYMANDPAELREPSLSAALSIAVVLGSQCVNAILAIIGFVGTPLDDAEPKGPALDAAEALGRLTVFVKAAADNRIDHSEEPVAEAAVDDVIEILTPYSTRGKAA